MSALAKTASTQSDLTVRSSVLASGDHENENLFSACRGARLRAAGQLCTWSFAHGTSSRETKHAHRIYGFQCQPFLVHIARPVVSHGVRHSASKRVYASLGEVQTRSGVERWRLPQKDHPAGPWFSDRRLESPRKHNLRIARCVR